MDAFIVVLSKSMYSNKTLKNRIIISLFFGFFQALMPIIGYFIGYKLSDIISIFSSYIAFIFLFIIGLNMIINKDNINNKLLDLKSLITLSILTSIDAFFIGISLAFLHANIIVSSLIIGFITFTICFIGTFLGKILRSKLGNKSKILGGVLLILIAIKILLEK